MQLGTPAAASSPLRDRLSKAALALLLLPTAVAEAAPATSDSTSNQNQFDYTLLYYGEQGRTTVFEPVVRATRLFGGGRSLFGQFIIDVITGASPTGALPSGTVQTYTSASGRLKQVAAGVIPMSSFEDRRLGFDGQFHQPLGKLFGSTLGVHASREKDYQSLALDGKITADLWHHTVTLTAGGGYDDDSVFPIGGTPRPLSDGTEVSHADNPKHVSSLLAGISRVLTRRWMMSLDETRTFESGYLTEPYKVISLVDPITGKPQGQLTDGRPETRTRNSLLLSSAYHFDHDIAYTSYRYYWDTWGVDSNTVDLSWRHPLHQDGWFLEPHFRLYHQSAADFFTAGIPTSVAPPDFATSDYRLGNLTTLTLGSTIAFRLGSHPGTWTVRPEYIQQFGDSSPPGAIGVQRSFDLAPKINTFTVVIGHSLG